MKKYKKITFGDRSSIIEEWRRDNSKIFRYFREVNSNSPILQDWLKVGKLQDSPPNEEIQQLKRKIAYECDKYDSQKDHCPIHNNQDRTLPCGTDKLHELYRIHLDRKETEEGMRLKEQWIRNIQEIKKYYPKQ